MTDNQEVADTMRITMAFLKAWIEDDEIAGVALIEAGPGRLIAGLADMMESMIQMLAMMVGTTPADFLDTLHRINLMLATQVELRGNGSR